MPTITPCLWFQSQLEEAVNFYATVFGNAKILTMNRAGGQVISAEFELNGRRFMALNGAPANAFTDAVSFFVGCETQREIDDLWAKLTAGGGAPGRCGWLKDRFGVSWQIVPTALASMLGGGGNPARAQRVMEAMLRMSKLDLDGLRRAYDGR